MNQRKILFSLLMILCTLIVVSLFWKISLLLCFLLMVLAVFKHQKYPIKHELVWFFTIGFIGSVVESAIMQLSGAWFYSLSQIFNIPLWLPFLWGLSAITGITLYEGITNSKT